MTALLPFLAGVGLLLLYSGLGEKKRPRAGKLTAALDALAMESGFARLNGRRLLAAGAASAIATFVLVAGVSSSVVVGVSFSGLAAWAPMAAARARRARRRQRFREAWPDAIATLVAGVRAGVSLPESCAALGERGPRELAGGFGAFAGTYRATGSFKAALHRLREQLSDPVADRVVASLLIAHEVGGTDLVRVLRTVGDFVREDLRVRKEIEARWSWTITAARVAAAAPWIVLLMMSSRPEAAAAYNSSTGALVISGGAALTVLGYRLMLRAARLPEEGRLGR